MWLFYQYPGEQIKARQRSPLYEMDGVGLFGHWILHGMDSEHSLSNNGENEERNLYKTLPVCDGGERRKMYIKKNTFGKQITGGDDMQMKKKRVGK